MYVSNIILVSCFCRQTVTGTIERFLATGNIINREHSGRPRLLCKEHYISIDNFMDENNELTTPKLKDKLVETFPNLKVSERTVARSQTELGWVNQNARLE